MMFRITLPSLLIDLTHECFAYSLADCLKRPENFGARELGF